MSVVFRLEGRTIKEPSVFILGVSEIVRLDVVLGKRVLYKLFKIRKHVNTKTFFSYLC